MEADGSFLVADRGNARVLRFREGAVHVMFRPIETGEKQS